MEIDLITCNILIFFGFLGAFLNAIVGGGAFNYFTSTVCLLDFHLLVPSQQINWLQRWEI